MRTLLCLGLAAALAACGGGGGESSSGPLARHFDDGFIGGVDMSQKAEMQIAFNEYSAAKFERAKVQADLSNGELQLQLAKNEVKGAKLKEDSARSTKKSAEQTADQNKVNEAMRQLRAAEKFRKAAEVRVKYLERYRDYMRAEMRASDDHVYWKEAVFELAKAKIAKANNIAPKGFAYDDYVRQEQQRTKNAASSRDKAGKEKQRALGARNDWLQIQGEADTMIGTKNQLPDPMAPKPVQGNDMTKGAGGITIGNEGAGSGTISPQ
jgi:hypothetical protein